MDEGIRTVHNRRSSLFRSDNNSVFPVNCYAFIHKYTFPVLFSIGSQKEKKATEHWTHSCIAGDTYCFKTFSHISVTYITVTNTIGYVFIHVHKYYWLLLLLLVCLHDQSSSSSDEVGGLLQVLQAPYNFWWSGVADGHCAIRSGWCLLYLWRTCSVVWSSSPQGHVGGRNNV